MDKKLLFILTGSILTLALLVFFAVRGWDYFTQKETGKCGDGVCENFLMGFMIVEPQDIIYVDDLGAKAERHEFWYLNNEFREMQANTIQSLMGKNFEIIANVRPMPTSVVLADYTDFKKKLKDLVKEKKGMFKYWQIGNEPDLEHAASKGEYSADDYTNLFLAAAETIRGECSECKIVLAGISNQYDSSKGNYVFYKDILAGIKKKSSYEKPIDAFDIHLYTDSGEGYAKAGQAVNDYKNLLKEEGYDYDIEFISTEFATYSGQPKTGFKQLSFQTEAYQAESLIKLYTTFFNAGVTKALWISISNFYQFGFRKETDGYFDMTGLIYHGKGGYDVANGIKAGTKKESYYAYKTLASKIQNKNTVEEIADNIYKFSGKDSVVYIAWSDGAKNNLPSSISGSVKITDYFGNESVKDASQVVIGNSPVFVETSLLEKTGEYDVTPVFNGVKTKGHRPDVTKVDNKLYLAYDIENTKEIGLAVLDKDLKQVSSSRNLFSGVSGNEMPTDIRTFSGSPSNFWYAVETADITKACSCSNKLNFAVYGAGGELILSKSGIAEGCPLSILMQFGCSPQTVASSWAVDDPTPIYLDSKYCVAIRKNSGPELQVMCFNESGDKIADNKINLMDIFGTMIFSQNAFVLMGGKPWIITGVNKGPPMGDGYASIYAIQLSDSLDKIVGKPIEIVSSPNKEYKTRVVAARMYNDYLFITYMNQSKGGSASTDSKGYLAVFDTNNGFAKLAEETVLDHSIAGCHLPMEIIGDKAYVFHEMEDKSIKALVYAIR